MQYKGFVARYYYAIEAKLYVGEIVNMQDVISFSANSFALLQEAMIEAVENYLEMDRALLTIPQT